MDHQGASSRLPVPAKRRPPTPSREEKTAQRSSDCSRSLEAILEHGYRPNPALFADEWYGPKATLSMFVMAWNKLPVHKLKAVATPRSTSSSTPASGSPRGGAPTPRIRGGGMRASPFTILTGDELPERLRGLDPYGRVEAALVGRIPDGRGGHAEGHPAGVDDTYFEHEVFRRAWVAARSCCQRGSRATCTRSAPSCARWTPRTTPYSPRSPLLFESPGYNARQAPPGSCATGPVAASPRAPASSPGEAESIEDYAAEVIHTGNEMVKIAGAIVDDGSEDQRSQWQVMDDDLEAAVQGKQGVMTGLRDLDAIPEAFATASTSWSVPARCRKVKPLQSRRASTCSSRTQKPGFSTPRRR